MPVSAGTIGKVYESPGSALERRVVLGMLGDVGRPTCLGRHGLPDGASRWQSRELYVRTALNKTTNKLFRHSSIENLLGNISPSIGVPRGWQ
jgi:hypothetical protein